MNVVSKLGIAGVLAASIVATTAQGASTPQATPAPVSRGADYVSPPSSPERIFLDARTRPHVPDWRPGDPIREIPRQFHGEEQLQRNPPPAGESRARQRRARRAATPLRTRHRRRRLHDAAGQPRWRQCDRRRAARSDRRCRRRLLRPRLQRRRRRADHDLQHHRRQRRGRAVQHGRPRQRRTVRAGSRRRRRRVRPARAALAADRVLGHEQHAVHLPQRRRQSGRHDLDALHVQHAGLPRLSEIRRLARRVLRRRQRRSRGVRARSRRDAGRPQRDAAAQVGAAPQRPRLPDGAAGHRVRHDAAAGRRARPLHPRQRRRAQQSGQQRSEPRFPRALHAGGRLGHADEHDADRTGAGAGRRIRFRVPDPERLRCDPSARHIADCSIRCSKCRWCRSRTATSARTKA